MSWRKRRLSRGGRWQSVRRQVFERDGYRCQECGKAGRLECDHRTPLHLDSEQDPFDLAGLQTLCRSCHIDKTQRENIKGKYDPRSWDILRSSRRSWTLFRDELARGSYRVDNFFVPLTPLFSTTIFQSKETKNYD